MSRADDVTDQLIESAVQIAGDFELEIAAHCLQDWITVLLAGWSDDIVTALVAQAEDEGGKPHATLLGNGVRASCAHAALINGAASHVLDFDDAHLGSRVHPSAPLWPAILALAEREGASGRQALHAFVAGVRMQTAFAALIGEPHYRRGWHNTATLGSLGAAVACGGLMGFDAEQMRDAIALAATRAAGLRAVFGSVAKPLQVGQAAANGVWAAQMASRGMSVAADVMVGETGFLALYGDGAEHPTLSRESADRALETITFKYHASCYGTQAPIEAALRIVAESGTPPTDVERVTVEVENQYLTVCNIVSPASAAEAKFSIRHMVALALAGLSTVDARSFSAAVREDPSITTLRERIEVIGVARARATAGLELLDHFGRTWRAEVDASRPETDLVHQRDKLARKTRAVLATGRYTIDAEKLIAACRGVGQAGNLSGWVDGLYAAGPLAARQHIK